MKKIAFIKFAGMASGGVEKYLQTIACLLPKDEFEIDFFYTNAAPFINSSFVHPDNDDRRIKLMEDNGINLIKVNVEAKIGDKEPYEWINTDLWDLFDESKYYAVQTGRGGYPEYPFNLINDTKIIDSIHSFSGEDKPNIEKAILLCEWQLDKWSSSGGNKDKAVVIPGLISVPKKRKSNLRQKLGIPENAFVFGFHQGNRSEIFSPASLMAYSKIAHENNYFLIMGGAENHRDFANKMSNPNVRVLDHSSSVEEIHDFLSSIDVFAHARSDGEVCSAAIIEALYHEKPVISHPALNMGHKEQIEGCGKMVESVDQYACEMVCMEKNRNYYQGLSFKAGEKYKSKYSYDAVKDKILKVYREIE